MTYTIWNASLVQAVDVLANFPNLAGHPRGIEPLCAYTRTQYLFDAISGKKLKVPPGLDRGVTIWEEYRRLGESLAAKAGEHTKQTVKFSGTLNDWFQFTLTGVASVEWVNVSTAAARRDHFNVSFSVVSPRTTAWVLSLVASKEEDITQVRVSIDHSADKWALGHVLADALRAACHHLERSKQ